MINIESVMMCRDLKIITPYSYCIYVFHFFPRVTVIRHLDLALTCDISGPRYVVLSRVLHYFKDQDHLLDSDHVQQHGVKHLSKITRHSVSLISQRSTTLPEPVLKNDNNFHLLFSYVHKRGRLSYHVPHLNRCNVNNGLNEECYIPPMYTHHQTLQYWWMIDSCTESSTDLWAAVERQFSSTDIASIMVQRVEGFNQYIVLQQK